MGTRAAGGALGIAAGAAEESTGGAVDEVAVAAETGFGLMPGRVSGCGGSC